MLSNVLYIIINYFLKMFSLTTINYILNFDCLKSLELNHFLNIKQNKLNFFKKTFFHFTCVSVKILCIPHRNESPQKILRTLLNNKNISRMYGRIWKIFSISKKVLWRQHCFLPSQEKCFSKLYFLDLTFILSDM